MNVKKCSGTIPPNEKDMEKNDTPSHNGCICVQHIELTCGL